MNNASSLISQKCIPCEGNVQPYTPEQIALYKPQIPDWRVLDNKKLDRDFSFKDFSDALVFINKVGAIAQQEGHHPDLFLHNWNKVTITLWTHAINGLFLNDFILAAKIDKLDK
jgi:4a-hydroxytetrahydrobiopterin dehydratase